MKPGLLHLGPKGLVTEPESLMRQLFFDSFTATAQQGKGMGQVFSIQYTSGLYGNNAKELERQLEEGLRNYYGAYFPEGVTVTTRELNPGKETRYTIEISIRVKHSGKSYDLNEVLMLDPDNTMRKIQDAT